MTLKEMGQLIILDMNDTKIHEFKTNNLTFNPDELLERNFENSKLSYHSRNGQAGLTVK